MAVIKIDFPTSGAPTSIVDYTELLDNVSTNIKGASQIPITEIGTTNTPQIANGSIFNAGGSLYIADSNTTITGTIGASRYIEMVPSGDTLVPTWTTSAPTWNHANNHYESGSGNLVLSIFRGIDLVNSVLTYNSLTTYENYKAYNFRQPIDVTSDIFEIDYGSPGSGATTTNVEPLMVIDVTRFSIKRLSFLTIASGTGNIDQYYMVGTTGTPNNKQYNDSSNTILFSDLTSRAVPHNYTPTYTATDIEEYDYLLFYVKPSTTSSNITFSKTRQYWSPMPYGASVTAPSKTMGSTFVSKSGASDVIIFTRFA